MRERPGSPLSPVLLCALTALSAALGFGILLAGASAVLAVVQSPSASGENPQEATAQASPAGSQAMVDRVAYDQLEQAVASPPQPAPSGKELGKERESEQSGTASGPTFTGMVTDARCGARHSMKSDKTSAECARACVRKGSRYVLVDGEEIHALEGDPTELDGLAGVRVDIVGQLLGDTIRVESMAAR
ncbi:MAG TPA: hypothetical protein VK513_00670 [Terriglobales bacterium]|nr:hypothetical protein [Terriglobales bacterium]